MDVKNHWESSAWYAFLNGHDDPHQQLSQLHPLLPHVITVQNNSEEDLSTKS